jgi:predicted NBD/HSP70 family sugar kinase
MSVEAVVLALAEALEIIAIAVVAIGAAATLWRLILAAVTRRRISFNGVRLDLARYLALALVSIICTLSPQRLILGGGVMQQQHLFPLLRHEVQHVLNGYLSLPDLDTRIDAYIVPPLLGDRAGVLGALALPCRTWTKSL